MRSKIAMCISVVVFAGIWDCSEDANTEENDPCLPQMDHQLCDENGAIWWYDACGVKNEISDICYCNCATDTSCSTPKDPMAGFVIPETCTDRSACLAIDELNCELGTAGKYEYAFYVRNICNDNIRCAGRHIRTGIWLRDDIPWIDKEMLTYSRDTVISPEYGSSVYRKFDTLEDCTSEIVHTENESKIFCVSETDPLDCLPSDSLLTCN